ncbi:MAG TPA: hypothetical protein DEP72_05040 [Clostridiales bacterium]|nr:MAG: hypothetical protein A2Y18_02140 [Clostridiales bacterium GWD2_32_19]HCC07506.1 hypothetical protein [Clostridiales bacterium]
MKKLGELICMLLIAITCSISLSHAATDSELIKEVSDKITFYKSMLTGDITTDVRDAVAALESKVNLISDYTEKTKLMEKVLELKNKMNDILTGKDLETIAKSIKFVFENGELYLSLPDTSSRYTYNVLVENTDLGVRMLSIKAKQNEKITLPTISKATSLKYTVEILYGSVIKNTATGVFKFTDTQAPKITAIYVLNNKLYIKATDNYRFADKRYIYIIGDQTYETDSYYEIDEYPTAVKVQVKDLLGNASSPYSVNVIQDAKVYFGDASNAIDEDIDDARESEITTNKYFKNIVIGEYGKELYYYDAFGTFLKKKVGNSYREADVTPTSTLTINKIKKSVLLNKEGVFELKFKNVKDNAIISTYVVVGDKDDKIESYYAAVRDNLPSYTTTDSITLKNYIELIPKSKYGTSVLDGKYIVIMVDDIAYSINSSIKLTNKSSWNIYIYNLATGEVIEHELYYKKLVKRVETLNDIKSHWARSSIVSLIEKNVVAGYSDLTFKPDNKVTVKEFIAMLNRLNPNKSRQTINPYDIGLSRDDWAYYEIKNVLSKVDYSAIHRSGLMNKYDYPITREEVALLVANYYQILEKPTDKYYSDLTQSAYSDEIQKLIANGILNGYNDNTVKPFNELTRAEAVTILGRIKN